MTTYSMGQYRFSSSSDTVKDLGASLSDETVAVSDKIEGSDTNTISLQDVAISRGDGEAFEVGKDYYAYYYVVYCLWHVVLRKRQKRKILQ